MQKNCVVLGGGLVGGFIARELAKEDFLAVTLVDIRQETLEAQAKSSSLKPVQADLSDPLVVAANVKDADIVLGAVPGSLGFQVLKAVIEAGKNAVDISFFPENPLELDELAQKHGVTVVVDCGVMPGLGGMLAARMIGMVDTPLTLKILVGGLPEIREQPFEYKAPFSPADVIEEYTRPARRIVSGESVVLPALSDIELLEFPGVGTLEAFNTDGLRTLAQNLDIPNMVEKTLRYPGHAVKIRLLKKLGFFSDKPIEIGGNQVVPRQVCEHLLFDNWKLTPGMRELTVMRIELVGLKDGQCVRHRFDLLDRTDELGEFSMSRTTGYPAILVARLMLKDKLAWVIQGELHKQTPGIVCPEWIGQGPSYESILDELGSLCIYLQHSEEIMEGN